MVEKAWRQGYEEASGHPEPRVKHQREVNAGPYFSFLSLAVRVGLPILIN